jgi:hypothetical protein
MGPYNTVTGNHYIYNHDIIGKVHSRAIPVSWKKRPVFSTGSQDSPPVSLVYEAHRLSDV